MLTKKTIIHPMKPIVIPTKKHCINKAIFNVSEIIVRVIEIKTNKKASFNLFKELSL
jgi:hypothetical protein